MSKHYLPFGFLFFPQGISTLQRMQYLFLTKGASEPRPAIPEE
jgi:hypothetical protein